MNSVIMKMKYLTMFYNIILQNSILKTVPSRMQQFRKANTVYFCVVSLHKEWITGILRCCDVYCRLLS